MVGFKRVVKYSVVLFLFLFLIGVLEPSKYIVGENINYYSVMVNYVFESIVVIFVFYMHAKRQFENLYANVAVIFILYNVTGFIFIFLIDGRMPDYVGLDVVLDLTVLIISIIFGTEFGRRIGRRIPRKKNTGGVSRHPM